MNKGQNKLHLIKYIAKSYELRMTSKKLFLRTQIEKPIKFTFIEQRAIFLSQ